MGGKLRKLKALNLRKNWLRITAARLPTFGHLGSVHSSASPRTELLLQGSYPFHPHPPHHYISHRHRHTHILSMKIRGKLLLVAVEWII